MDIHPADPHSYSLRVDVLARLYPNNYIDSAVAQHWLGQIVVYDMQDEINIGTIEGYHITSCDVAAVVFYADHISTDFCTAAEWLYQEEEAFLNSLNAHYIERVELVNSWRGRRLALRAVALYLQFLVEDGFIFFQPAPPKAKNNRERQQGIRRLHRFWRRLGVSHYNLKHNVMWEPVWSCPQWLLQEDWL